MRKIETAIMTRQRSEEEKERRRLYGDKGAKFSQGKVPKIDRGGRDWNGHYDGHERLVDNRDL